MTLERDIETYLIRQCQAKGWLCEKFTSPNRRSVPDRIITSPNRVTFVECKAPGKKPTKLQDRDHERRRKFGCDVWVVDSKKMVDLLIGHLAYEV
jgi:hypothetical protein